MAKELPVTSIDDPRFHEPSYELGYREGMSSGYASWIEALDELPFDVTCPEDVLKAFRKLSATSSKS